jgi:succinate dehydrogenase / fumarate reductase cytochrome b subunit
MSITGLFLILFLCVHLTVNLLLLVSPEAFNAGCEFMALPVIKVIEPILALGFIIHIIWASVLTLQNQKARPTKYALRNQSQNCTWASRNMYILGALVLAFLALHICTIWYNFKFGDITDHYELVSSRLEQPVYGIIYIIAAILLGLHLSHGFWSAFQTIGFSNQIWRKRLEYVAYFFAFVFGIGFSIIPLYFMIFGA